MGMGQPVKNEPSMLDVKTLKCEENPAVERLVSCKVCSSEHINSYMWQKGWVVQCPKCGEYELGCNQKEAEEKWNNLNI